MTDGPDVRRAKIAEILSIHFPDTHYIDINSFYKGPFNNKTTASALYVEFSNREQSESVFNQIRSRNLEISSPGGNKLRIDKTRSKLQTHKNYCLWKAKELILSHPSAANKSISIKWKANPRAITVDVVEEFTQFKTDIVGTFVAPFSSLAIP